MEALWRKKERKKETNKQTNKQKLYEVSTQKMVCTHDNNNTNH
jgi:hypothetical protein